MGLPTAALVTLAVGSAVAAGAGTYSAIDSHKAAKAIAWIRKNCPDAEALLWDNADRMLEDEDFLYH